MKANTAVRNTLVTHEGAMAHPIHAEQQLRRSVMSCLLWENEFYEDGQTVAQRIMELVPRVEPKRVAAIAIEAREKMNLRHVPLLIVREMVRASTRPDSIGDGFRLRVEETLARVIQRADEPAEFLALYWQDGKKPIPHCVRRGLATALGKFNEYSLAKYRGDGKAIKLRDVFRMVRPVPKDAEQAALWSRVVKNELATPDTWEVELSASDGVSKHDKWARMLGENKLGALALLRNLRNMEGEKVSDALIRDALIKSNVARVLPFRFIAAARHAPRFEPELESKLFESIGDTRLPGMTAILVDISPSMEVALSAKSDMTRMDAACGVAMVGREMCEDVRVFSFSSDLVAVPPRRGFALRDAIVHSQQHNGTLLGKALAKVNALVKYDRIIIITDEQSQDTVGLPTAKGYMINVASARNGIGYGAWTHIDGFSEAVFGYIVASEANELVAA